MPEYKVMSREVTSALSRDLPRAAVELANAVTAEMSSGWKPQGGVTSVQAGNSVYLLQALVKSE